MEAAGFDREFFQAAIQGDLLNKKDNLPSGLKNGFVLVNGARLDYTAFKLADGTVNIRGITPPRKIMVRGMTSRELMFVKMILTKCKEGRDLIPRLENLKVEDMDDGGMRGLKFISTAPNRVLGKEVSSVEFEGQDKVKVFASISLDQYGDLFELDIWKIDFSPVLMLPER